MQQRMPSGAIQPGRLMNANHELLAFGDCEMQNGGDITMRVEEEHVAQPHRARGPLALALDDGSVVTISSRFVRLQVRAGEGQSSTVYRLHVIRS